MRDITKVRVGWPLLAVLVAAISVFDAAYEGAGPLMLFLVPAGIVGFVLGRITTTPEGIVAGIRDQAGRGIAIAIGLALAALVAPRVVSALGPVGVIVVPILGLVVSGYLVSVATRRDVLDAVERSGGQDRW
ncbi:MAG: hypothetical protein E6H87_05355 [Chloroflexi bacterium]|nr:MAG: hypothetical protein E6I14_02590 [Chloroflexota bacterium]TMG61829.1 MAG: hypothetical protein E6H87_05355 [Chloroflexota bacterium]